MLKVEMQGVLTASQIRQSENAAARRALDRERTITRSSFEVFAYTAEVDAEIRRLWLEGLSASDVVQKLAIFLPEGVKPPSRNAIIGKVHRMGLTRSPSMSGSNHWRSKKSKAEARKKALSENKSAPPPVPATVARLPKVDTPPPVDMPDNVVPYSKLDDHPRCCRWPYGNVHTTGGYCPNPQAVVNGKTSSFCEGHHAVAWVKVARPAKKKEEATFKRSALTCARLTSI